MRRRAREIPRAYEEMSAQGSPFALSRRVMLPTFQRSGRSLESDSSSQSMGVATGAPGRARTAYGGTAVCA